MLVFKLEYNQYHALVEYSQEDKMFIGEVIGIRDLLSFHASSVDNIQEKFENCINNYLNICEIINKAPEQTKISG